VQGRDVNLDIKRVVGYRQFCNKLWNGVRFALMYVSDLIPSSSSPQELASLPGISKRDLYILSRLNRTIIDCNQQLSEYNFGAVTSTLHSFFLYDVCDVYLELIKPVVNDSSDENKDQRYAARLTLYVVIEQFLRLTHPLMPFVTEELWQRLPNREHMTNVPSIMIASYPEEMASWTNPAIESDMEIVKELITNARSVRTEYRIPNHVKAEFAFQSIKEEYVRAIQTQSADFCTLAKGLSFTYLPPSEAIPKGWGVKVINDQVTLLINLTGLLDVEVEIARLNKELERIEPFLESYRRKIAVPDYESKVPENVRATNAEKLAAYETEYNATINAKAAFEAMKK
jgi:valyl-tRNA synthetase